MKKPTIYDIKYYLSNAPYFFERKTLKFFRQTMRDFRVYTTDKKNIFMVVGTGRDCNGTKMESTYYFERFTKISAQGIEYTDRFEKINMLSDNFKQVQQ